MTTTLGRLNQEARHRLADCYLDELLARINDFFHGVPDELKPLVYSEYWSTCEVALKARARSVTGASSR